MGFDLTINLNVGIDPGTGMAFVWNNKTTARIPFIPSEYIIPEQFHKYIKQRGSHFHSYITHYDEKMTLVEVERFFDDYPEWNQVKEDIGDADYDWKEMDHDGFKAALTWLNSGKNKGVFSISWSY